jgi:hypothetical protein
MGEEGGMGNKQLRCGVARRGIGCLVMVRELSIYIYMYRHTYIYVADTRWIHSGHTADIQC